MDRASADTGLHAVAHSTLYLIAPIGAKIIPVGWLCELIVALTVIDIDGALECPFVAPIIFVGWPSHL